MASMRKNGDSSVLRTWKGYRMGHSHHNAKLNEEAVRNIRYRNQILHEGYIRIGKSCDLSPSTIRDICTYRTWIHVH